MEGYIKKYGLSGNALKIIAALSMLIDHIGLIFFPHSATLRIIGRLSFPIFAYMIAEGCEYTRNKLKYFLSVFLLGAVCQAVYYIADGSEYLGILITFSISILTVYTLQYFKNTLASGDCGVLKRVFAAALLVFTVSAVYVLNIFAEVDYGFFGCMAPVFASLFRAPRGCEFGFFKSLDKRWVHILMLGICMFVMSLMPGARPPHSLLALPLLLLYSGGRGRLRMKYFFYIFYPAHLALLWGIAYLIGK